MESHVDSDHTLWLSEDVRGYDRLWRKKNTPKSVLCAQDDFDFTLSVSQGPVVRLEGLWRNRMGCTFLVMTKPSDPFWLMLTKPTGTGALHEKVFSRLPQRVHVDWEMMLADFPIQDVEKAHDAIAEALVDSIYNVMQPCDVKDIVLAYSSGKTDAGYKLSFRLYVRNVLYPNTASVAVVVERAQQLLQEQGDIEKAVARGFDMSVYRGSNHDFRMLGCAKDGRVLQLSPWSKAHGHTDQDTLIQPPDAYVLGCRPALAECTAPRTAFHEPVDEDAAASVGMVMAVLGDAFVYTGLSPAGTLVFERRRPSMCEVKCGRVHDNDHMYAFIGDNGAVWLKCRRDPSKRRQVGSLRPRPVLETRVEEANRLREAEHPILPQLRAATHSHETSHELVDFKAALERTNTLCVRAPMGIGKTMGLAAMLREMPSSTKVVALSFRETFTTDFVGKLDGAQDYRQVKGAIDLDKTPFVVVQMESLYRLQGTPDLLVLDESEMNIEQFHSSTMDRRRTTSYAKFVDLVKRTPQVLALDAKMTMRTIDELQRHGRQVHLAICNRHLQVETKCQVTSNRSAWEASLLEAIAQGRNIIIPSGSAAEANIVLQMIQEKAPDTRAACFTGATSETVKSECFADVNGTWSQYQVVIYSPTVLAGISFEEEHFHCLFGYFHNRSVTAGGAIQMLGRVRHLIDKEMVICLNDNPLQSPQTEEAIEEFLCSDRYRLLTAQGQAQIPPCIPVELAADGGYVYPYKDGYYRTWIQNMLVVNQSRARFTQTFLNYLAETGVNLTVMPEIEKEKAKEANASHKRSAVHVERDQADALYKAVDVSEEQFYRWCDSGTKQLTDGERLSFQKAWLKRNWQYPVDKRVTKKWILAHNRPRALTVFQNLWVLRSKPGKTIDEVLAEMQRNEQHLHQHGNAERDLHYAYKHTYHDLAIRILRCGFDAPWSESTALRQDLQAAILALGPELRGRRKDLNQRFERHVKEGGLQSFKQLLGLCGTITSKMYGVKLVADGKRLFKLKRFAEFDLAMERFTNK